MRYLRMLSNAVVAALFGVALLAVLVLQLNPRLPWRPGVVAGLVTVLAASYGGVLAALFYLAILARATFARERLSPGWLSLRILAWVCTVEAAAGAALMWANVDSFAPVLDVEAARRMTIGASAVSVSAFLLLVIAVLHYSFGRRGNRVGGTLFALTVAAALALPLAARGRALPEPPPPMPLALAPPSSTPSPRLHVILLDGASLEYIVPATAEGRLPHFGQLLDAGASLHLTTIRPTQPATVWTATMTGKAPSQNGVRSAERYRFLGGGDHAIELLPDRCFAHALVRWGWLEAESLASGDLLAHPLWRIVSAEGQRVRVVGVPLTAPVTPVNGVLVAEHTSRHAERLPGETEARVFPPALAARVSRPRAVDPPSSPEADGPVPVQLPTVRDAWYRHARAVLDEEPTPVLDVVRYDSLDVAGHYFLRYALPRAFGDVSPEERAKYGQAVARQYEVIDEEIGRLMAGLVPGDLLLVVSGFGMEAVSPARRVLARVLGDAELTGTHEGGPDGFLLAYGIDVAPGRRRVGSVLDVAPTALYFLGLPVARDMDGEPRTDLFRAEFVAERPVTFIPSYDRR